MPDYIDTKSRAGQVFHNFVDLMVKVEVYSDIATEVNALLENVEKECIVAVEESPESSIEKHWLSTLQAFREYLRSIEVENLNAKPARIISIKRTAKGKVSNEYD